MTRQETLECSSAMATLEIIGFLHILTHSRRMNPNIVCALLYCENFLKSPYLRRK